MEAARRGADADDRATALKVVDLQIGLHFMKRVKKARK